MSYIELKIEFKKILIAIIPSGYFVLTSGMQEAVFTLVMFLILDTVTGWVKASGWFCGGFCSEKIFNFKKMILYMIGLLLAFELSKLPFLADSFICICAWFSTREAWSVMENLADCGLEFPQQLVQKVSGQLKTCNIKKKDK